MLQALSTKVELSFFLKQTKSGFRTIMRVRDGNRGWRLTFARIEASLEKIRLSLMDESKKSD